jgi:hypothetical protein
VLVAPNAAAADNTGNDVSPAIKARRTVALINGFIAISFSRPQRKPASPPSLTTQVVSKERFFAYHRRSKIVYDRLSCDVVTCPIMIGVSGPGM